MAVRSNNPDCAELDRCLTAGGKGRCARPVRSPRWRLAQVCGDSRRALFRAPADTLPAWMDAASHPLHLPRSPYGQRNWGVEMPSFIGHVVVSQDTVLLGGWRGYTRLMALEVETGELLWETEHAATRTGKRWFPDQGTRKRHGAHGGPAQRQAVVRLEAAASSGRSRR
jgi:hypothetical protein